MSDNYLKKESGNNNVKVMGAIFIFIGVLITITMYSDFELENWWALFMLVPVGFSAMQIVKDYQTNGRFTSQSTGALIGMFSILLVMSVFLFGFSWNLFFPVGIIFAGIAILLSGSK